MFADTEGEINILGADYTGAQPRRPLQISGNKANYPCLQRDTGTGLSVLLVP
jgi:hypothetical protein